MTSIFMNYFPKKINLDFCGTLALGGLAVCAPVGVGNLSGPFLVELESLVVDDFGIFVKRDIVLFVTKSSGIK